MKLFQVSAGGSFSKGQFHSGSRSEGAVSATVQIDQLGQIQGIGSSLQVACVQSISVPGTVLPVHGFALWKSRMPQFESMSVQNGVVKYSVCILFHSASHEFGNKFFSTFKTG